MATLTAYFDDSGQHGQTKVQALCGFVSTVDQWLLFERDWRHVLQMPQFDLEDLHMKKMNSGKGRYARFQNNLPLQAELFDRLQRVIKSRIIETFAGAVFLDDYDRLNREFMVTEYQGPPVVMAAQLAIVKLMKWKESQRASDSIQIVVDQGIDHWGLLDDSIYGTYGFRLQPAPVAATPPLQACDHAAWEVHRALTSLATGKARYWSDQRGSLRALLRRLAGTSDGRGIPNWFVCDEEELRRVFALPGGPPKREA